MPYSSEIAGQILNKFRQKGWNLYKADRLNELGADETIRQCHAEALDLNGRYTLLPAVADPRDPEQVMQAIEALAVRLGREMPTIDIGYKTPLTGFSLLTDRVKVHTPEGTGIPYKTFLSAIDSFVDARS